MDAYSYIMITFPTYFNPNIALNGNPRCQWVENDFSDNNRENVYCYLAWDWTLIAGG
jgi:hypothetical protein